MKKLVVLFSALYFVQTVPAQFEKESVNFLKYEGFLDFQYDESTDKIYLEIDELEKEFLYVYSLSSGIGSNDIGLDRGQLGNEQIVYFEKAGNKLLLVQPNLKFRAVSDNALERASIKEAFARSVLGGFEIKSEQNGTYIIDITEFLLRDAHEVSKRLKTAEQGNYSLDKNRSAMNLNRTKAFPKNIEFDVTLTFSGESKGAWIKSVVPNPDIVTVNQHHSFVALPDENYRKRVFDPRCGSYPFSYYDYATPVYEPVLKQFVTRHRLEKKNPELTMSEAVEPIIYYLDNGTPEPIRSALLDGGRWWNEAFEAIGYRNAFQVKILPETADPLDVRYNVIQWVHRSTRGWSYGSSVTDPRTGEIIKGHVSLGSLRIRQDFLLAQGLMNKPFKDRDDNHDAMLDMALARIRQLSAHEIGHTLGFAHNFASSANDRASVMDYPHPQLRFKKGQIDFSQAYDSGIGMWDKVMVAYSYADFPSETDERKALDTILRNAYAKGLRYISDRDARAHGGAHALAHLWDNGLNASSELEEVLKVRNHAIANFSRDNIRDRESFSILEDVFVPLYFFHRYQTEAAAKLIGGLDYNYAVKGDGQLTVKVIDAKTQQKALESILKTLQADQIAVPADKLELFPPRAIGYPRTRESFKGKTGVSFDALSAPETAADMTLRLVLHPERASRLIQQKSLHADNLGLKQVLDQVVAATIEQKFKNTYLNEVQQGINFRVLFHLMHLASNENVHVQVNAIAHDKLRELHNSLDKSSSVNREISRRIDDFQKDPKDFDILVPPRMPDGSPIGMDCYY
ncbi:zinc-dependent metalloprotease [Pareuzebyella sediminis]|uniref:zinc-dependent metalloprotease n=1 Tax=Pareuzebyella sediminis TaxID=2607998 RepID=UPI0011F09B53|nr:zinc-dependent metalloprotease [Pareuzebyella sediminis]